MCVFVPVCLCASELKLCVEAYVCLCVITDQWPFPLTRDLANRILRVGGNPNDVIKTCLEMALVTDPRAQLVARYSISANLAR